MSRIYEFVVKLAGGKEISMEEYKDKVLLIVNTATHCGFTSQYDALEDLYRKYRGKGLEILDFPCNQFAHQAPENIEEIAQFCKLKYDTSFPLFDKVDVNGKNAEPLFTYLKSCKTGIMGSDIKWNFTKFLVSKTGEVVGRYAPFKDPYAIEDDIVRELMK